MSKVKVKNDLINGLAKIKSEPIDKPVTTQRVIETFFNEFYEDTKVFKIKDGLYSICFEYSDISFAKAKLDVQENIFLKWVDYLNSFSPDCHIQVINIIQPINSKTFEKEYMLQNVETLPSPKIAEETNQLIELGVGNINETLESKRYIAVTIKNDSYDDVKEKFIDIQLKSEEKFKELGSSIRRISVDERLEILYNFFNCTKWTDKNNLSIKEYAKKENATVYDILAPKSILFKNKDFTLIDNKKFVKILYLDDLPSSLTPKLYNVLSKQKMELYITQNINPTNSAKSIKKVNKKITGMKSERLAKIRRAAKQHIDYNAVKDEKLEDKLRDTKQLRNDLQKNNQKIFRSNLLIMVVASNADEMNRNCKRIMDIAGEQLCNVKPLLFQQLEGIQNVLPFSRDNSQILRTITSEATAVHVPFNTKDLIHKDGIYYGVNLLSKNPVIVDRKKQLNGNGCVLATAGAGKSFIIKFMIEQIMNKYPDDDVIIVDLNTEYNNIIKEFNGQTLEISNTSKTYLNPFHMDIGYDDKEPIKSKIEWILAWCESLLGGRDLTGSEKSIIDRCVKNLFFDYERSGFSDKSLIPNLKKFWDELSSQQESEAKNLALIMERYAKGSLEMFAHETNIDIHNRLVSFDISKLPESILKTGYLVVLDHIWNRITNNRKLKKNTWIIIDEFHVLLENVYSAQFVAKLYKEGRKYNSFPTIITQNIADILENKNGRKILSNSEFAVVLKQKPLDLVEICKIFDISNEEASYITSDISGQGIIVYGNSKVPFRNNVPKDFYIYKLNDTSNNANIALQR